MSNGNTTTRPRKSTRNRPVCAQINQFVGSTNSVTALNGHNQVQYTGSMAKNAHSTITSSKAYGNHRQA